MFCTGTTGAVLRKHSRYSDGSIKGMIGLGSIWGQCRPVSGMSHLLSSIPSTHFIIHPQRSLPLVTPGQKQVCGQPHVVTRTVGIQPDGICDVFHTSSCSQLPVETAVVEI